jgi:hypothetical protein
MPEIEDIVRRVDKRPGFKVASHCEVGLPVFLVSPLVTLREHSPIGVLEETVLKCIDDGDVSVAAMTEFLGIPRDIVLTQIGALMYEQAVREDPKLEENYALSARGVTRLADLATTRVYKDDIRLYVDGLTRQIVPIEQTELYSARQLEAQGLGAILPTPRDAPKVSEITVSDVNRLFAFYTDKDRSGQQVVKVEGYVKRTQLMFRRSIAMAFKSDTGRAMQIAFAIDGRMSEEHELAFSRSGADQRSAIFRDLFDANRRRVEINNARRHIQEFAPRVLKEGEPSPRKSTTLALPNAAVATPQLVRTLSSYEHPPILADALENCQKRLLLISPWIRRNVVDQKFIEKVTHCLERGVEVTVAYGFGRADRGERSEDLEAKQELEKLALLHSNLQLIRKSNIHAKVLLVDSRYFVTTSFNWLSFRGDPNQPLREEEGTYVEGSELVDEYFLKLRSRLLMAAPQTGDAS